MPDEAKLVADMLQDEAEKAMKAALERFYHSRQLKDVWPNVARNRLPLAEVEIIVLPLDRIGAPAGASGAGVYVAYYSHAAGGQDGLAASLPLVVKIGPAKKLREEMKGARKWPLLIPQQKAKFALPLKLYDQDKEHTILLAPFQSKFRPAQDGRRNDVQVRDLWKLLVNKNELSPTEHTNWDKISALVEQALDAMEPAHRAGRGQLARAQTTYATQYSWYLRNTLKAGENSAQHLPSALFGDEPMTHAFGGDWPNPTFIVRRIIDAQMSFDGVLGPVHGDLHPKNIVLSDHDTVQIIDFGWAATDRHIAMDYILLDLNLRGTTLPSQVSQDSVLKFAAFLGPKGDPAALPVAVQDRARIIKDVIWHRLQSRVVTDWRTEYLIPLFLVGYGLLVHLDSARNQPALVATVLQLAKELDATVPAVATA